MEFLTSLSLLLTIALQTQCAWCKFVTEEPVCTSRYDFESKLLHNMVKLDFDMSVLKESFRQEMDQLVSKTTSAIEKLETLASRLERDLTSKVSELTTLEGDLKRVVGDKITALEAAQTVQADDFDKLYKGMEEKVEQALQAGQGKTKPAVAFLFKTVADTSPGSDALLKFTAMVIDTHQAYSRHTGHFTAPAEGTYFFAVQICPVSEKSLQVQIYADEVVIADSLLYHSETWYACFTVNGVAVLKRGSSVCVKSRHSDSGTTIHQDEKRWASFMGALLQ